MRNIFENKKAQNMTIGTIILIVLGLVVLVILVLGFSMGWSDLWGNIKSYFSKGDVKSVVQACQFSVTAENAYDFCCKARKAKFSEDIEQVTCNDPRIRGQITDPLTCDANVCEQTFITTCKNACPELEVGEETKLANPSADDSALKAKIKKYCCKEVQTQTCYERGEICKYTLKAEVMADPDADPPVLAQDARVELDDAGTNILKCDLYNTEEECK